MHILDFSKDSEHCHLKVTEEGGSDVVKKYLCLQIHVY